MSQTAFVLGTFMPPTRGHRALIEFASALTAHVQVHIQTQPGEPYVKERVQALEAIAASIGPDVRVRQMHKTLPQEPTVESEAKFWSMWAGFLKEWGIKPGDYIVASESYGIKLAEITGAIFIPFDMNREIVQTRATRVREGLLENFADIAPEFQPVLRKTVTIFGAESTGKSTLTKALAERVNGLALPEWARPYLETVGPEITVEKMEAIWYGQTALQRYGCTGSAVVDYPVVVQDTDLFSTIGYWEAGFEGKLGKVPEGLLWDAEWAVSDLYIITRSNIPFEPDPLRYGGDKREMSDEWWIEFAMEHGIPNVILESETLEDRIDEAEAAVRRLFASDIVELGYKRS